MGRKNKPHDPGAATRAALERKEREQEIKRLRDQGATVSTDRGGQIISARRSNVFTLLLARGAITTSHHDAAYTLANDWAAWKGLDGKPETVGSGAGSAELITDRMLQAGGRVQAVMRTLPAQDAKIMEAFMIATVEEDRPMVWRGIMERLGYVVRDKQTQAFVGALEALRVLYHEPRRAAA